MSDNINVNVDIADLMVVLDKGDNYNINIQEPSTVVINETMFYRVADYATNAGTASFALTASYVQGVSTSWNTLSDKPAGIVSSSEQALLWTVATASYVLSTGLPSNIISSSTQVDYNLLQNLPTTIATASLALTALTASYVSGAVTSWESLVGKPSGIVSSSIQILDYNLFATTGSNVFVGTQIITGSIILTGSISSVDYIDISTTATAPSAVGRLQWDDANGTAVLGLKGGQVNLQIGQEVVARVFNEDTVSLVNGDIVYITGAQGNRVAVKRASATREFGSANTLGMVTEPIAVGEEGFITLFGVVNQLNTIGLTAGALLWLSTTPGQFTQTRPEAPAHGVSIGYVERVHATVGSVYVKVDNGYELDELHDVNDTSTTSSFGDLLIKSGSIWINSRQLTGSYGLTGSFNILGGLTGSLFGTASNALTSSFALTASYVSGAASDWDSVANKPAGIVSSSTQVDYTLLLNIPSNLVSQSSQITLQNTFGNLSASRIDGVVSYSLSSSFASSSISSSFAETSSLAYKVRIFSGSVGDGSAVYTGSFTGSFYGDGSNLTGIPSIISSGSAPNNPDTNELWYDDTTGKTYIYYVSGSVGSWVLQSDPTYDPGLIISAATASIAFSIPSFQPATPQTGSIYFSSGFLYVYDGQKYVSSSLN